MGETIQTQDLASIGPIGKPTIKGVGIGESAVPRLKALLAERQTPNAGLRIQVKGGGETIVI